MILSNMRFAYKLVGTLGPLLPRAVVNRRLSTCSRAGRRLLGATVLAAVCMPLAVGQTAPSSSSSSATRPVAFVDKVLGWVKPGQPTHLTEKERFQIYTLYTIGPLPLIGELAVSGVNQWANRPEEWGQGWDAFGKRYGSNLAYNGVRQVVTYGTSAMFREDNRYFASQKSGFWPRTKHALVSTFTARRPDGRVTFSFSSVVGVGTASGVSSIWGPPSWKGIGNIAETAGFSFAGTAGFNLFREFAMDVFHRQK